MGPRACSLSVEMPTSAPEPVFGAVREAGGGVDHGGGAVDAVHESLLHLGGLGQHGVGVAGAVAVDVIHGAGDAVHHAHGEDEIEVFLVPVGLDGGLHGRVDGPDHAVSAQLHVVLDEAVQDAPHALGGQLLVQQQGLHGVAHAGPLGLGVDDDALGVLEVGGLVHVDVADAFVVLDDRHAGLLHHGLDEALAAAGDDDVHVARVRQQGVHEGMVGLAHELHAAGVDALRLAGRPRRGGRRRRWCAPPPCRPAG